MRRALTLIIAGSVSLALSATPSQALVPTSDAPPVSASSASRTATTIPATLAASAPTAIPYTPPAMNWRSCGSSMPSTARCATLVVPRDWGSKRVAGTYDIAVARIPASSPGKRRGVLTFNPGGPGSAALSNISWVYGLLPTKVRERFDLVAWDPRGVGMSQPVISGCNGKSPHAAPTGPVDWKAWVTKFVKAQAATAAACLKLNRDTAPYVGTWQIVHDVDALREALGEKTLSFWGMSYGSTVGRAYAQYFPSRVRALLLDGVISPVSTIELWSREHTWDDPAAINTMLDAFGPEYRRKYAVVFSALDTKTLPYEGGRLNRWEAGYSIIQWASFQTTWSSARYLIDRLYDAASKRSSRSIKRAARASAWFDPHYTYVNCADMPDRPSIDQLTAIAEEGFRSGGVPVAQSALREGAQCAGLPSLGRPLGQITVPITLSTPPLIANSIADNRTPWSAALEMVEAFTGAGLVRYGGTHHIIYGRTTPCVHEPITRYLTKLKVPAAEVRCPLVWYG